MSYEQQGSQPPQKQLTQPQATTSSASDSNDNVSENTQQAAAASAQASTSSSTASTSSTSTSLAAKTMPDILIGLAREENTVDDTWLILKVTADADEGSVNLANIAQRWYDGANGVKGAGHARLDEKTKYIQHDEAMRTLKVSLFYARYLDFNKVPPPFFTEIYHGILFLIDQLQQQNVSYTFTKDCLEILNSYGNFHNSLAQELSCACLKMFSDGQFVSNLHEQHKKTEPANRPSYLVNRSKLHYYHAAYKLIIMHAVRGVELAQAIISMLLQEKDRQLGILEKKYPVSRLVVGKDDWQENYASCVKLFTPIQQLFAFLNEVYLLTFEDNINFYDALCGKLRGIGTTEETLDLHKNQITFALINSCVELLNPFCSGATTFKPFVLDAIYQDDGTKISENTKKNIINILSSQIMRLANGLFQATVKDDSTDAFKIQKKIICFTKLLEQIKSINGAYRIYSLLQNAKVDGDLAESRKYAMLSSFHNAKSVSAVGLCIAILEKDHTDFVEEYKSAAAKSCKQ